MMSSVAKVIQPTATVSSVPVSGPSKKLSKPPKTLTKRDSFQQPELQDRYRLVRY